ncbi:DNA sulfur modification protein DndB [Aetokthonos hydrillicola Thurmond2011]|jgi:DNA sulfur modification protein DndB|uniref:DNA sulfur modification protein DndB n=1 Tax=Aetokthonos hydrillicola Thurmond2011 TaxID=2712845 RepID=A0AAP5I5T0_9CYAN|nr:DNA sulfur modification protein DndB [Aetokthonos hydrillicola]MBO3459111.1 DGQHR domain-containing protein [Aetokthonos hydrillicola CCALA 1050]MBW4584715.1 DNA sulfur modification protein DndB [Aetokthonos hydrillicola CCALA 1050]MDR9895259.1 DNA sulfur modification protein DndB [Aetokthonos hydrillicola Thurmond2011]
MFELVIKGVPVQRGHACEHMSYVASITFGDVARLLNDGHLYIPNISELPDFAQRKLNTARVKAIARYILETYQDGTTFFPPICVNVQPSPTYRDGNIYLPYHSVSLRLTDGQHRCYGIRQALQDIQTQESEYAVVLSRLEIGVLIYAALSLEEERQAFRDQNLLVQRPSVSLSHMFDKRSPKVFIAKKLLQSVPHFRNNVETVETSLGKHNSKLLTLATLVAATQHMFPHLQSKKNLESFIDWATTFWAAVASVLPQEPWSIKSKDERAAQRQESLAVSAPIFQALGMLAHDLYQEGIPAENLAQWLGKLQEIDWKRNSQLWQERGVTQIGAQGEAIIPNTKTTISACHRLLREFVGVTPVSGVI